MHWTKIRSCPLLPMQSEELRELAKLAMEASELLFEMTAMGDAGDGVKEMVSKAKQLQACVLAACTQTSVVL